MAVNLFPPEPSEIYSVPGVVLGVAAANIRNPTAMTFWWIELAWVPVLQEFLLLTASRLRLFRFAGLT